MSAAQMLTGMTLTNGWRVMAPAARSKTATGGHFSTGYLVEHPDGRRGFLKAMDYSAAFEPHVSNTAEMLNFMTSAYLFERQVCEACASNRLRRVVHAIDAFTFTAVPGDPLGRVECLIFERAEGDIRAHLDAAAAFDIAFAFRTLHNVAVGLEQLHRTGIAHQDLKPSNVLVFTEQGGAKVSDFGRAWSKDHPAPHDRMTVAGDRGYAPPELLYGDVAADAVRRRFGCDAYHLGNLVAFLFARAHMTGLIVRHLDPAHRPGFWRGDYATVLPYVQAAFADSLAELRGQVPPAYRDEVVAVVEQLCQPDPALRGHPANGRGHSGQYSLERYISTLDLLAWKAEVRLKTGGAA